MKIFRWQGVLAFALIGILVAGFLFLFLDGMIERGIEEEGSKAAKTQIDIGSLTTSLLAQSITLTGIEVASPDNNMENVIQFDSLALDLDGTQAIAQKIVIDELQAQGIKLNQKRTHPAKTQKGASPTQETTGPADSGTLSLPGLGGLDMKSPAEILKSEKLETLEAGKRTKKIIADLKSKWEGKFAKDLNPKVLEETKQKLAELQKKIQGGGLTEIPQALQDFQALQKDIQSQVDRIKAMKSELQQDIQLAKQQVADLKNLPQKDFNRLKNKYSLNPEGGKNIVGALLEGPLKEKLDKAWKVYKLISPYLNKGKSPAEPVYVRGKGIDIAFAKTSPDFLVKHGNLSLVLFDTEVKGEIHDLSDNQIVYGKPAKMHFKSDKNNIFDSFALDIIADKTRPQSQDTIALNIQGLNLKNTRQAELQGGSAQITGQLTITDENNLQGNFKAELNAVSLSIPEQKGNELANTLAQSLSKIDRINIAVGISGTIESYQFDIKSNLSDIIGKAVKNIVGDKMKNFEGDLMSAIQSQTSGVLSGANGSLSGLLGQNKILNDSNTSYSGLLGDAPVTKKGLPIPKSGLALPDGLKLPF
ncbi:MAG: TIGR03545 family protein [Nitrospinaceae bacterium]|nr:TIGR03545 family protein [Nitrospinaceae bacterium]